MKKILYIHHAGNFSGAARSMAYLLEGLDRTEYVPEILIIQKGTATDFFKKTGIKVIVNNKLYPFHGTTVSGMSFKRFVENWIGFFLTCIRFPKVLKEINPDIIHLNTSCLFTFALVAKLTDKNIKVISHVREPLLDSFHGSVLRYFNEKFVDQLIAISHYDGSKFKANEKIKVIYNFVDTNRYKPQAVNNLHFRSNLKIKKNAVVFLYLSRVSATNGAMELITVARELAKSHPDFAFIVAGFDEGQSSDYNTTVKTLSENADNIFLLSMVENVIELIAESDVIVSPFTTPHFSRSVIEGAAMAKPAIVSDVGSQNELVDDGQSGIIYSRNDPSSLKNALIKLGSNKELREKMGEKARGIALEKFSSAKNINETVMLYDDCGC